MTNSLVWTTDLLASGRGKSQVRLAEIFLDDIEKHTRRGNADLWAPSFVCRIWYIPDDPGGDSVQAAKKMDGLLVLMDEEFVVAREYGWARTIVEFGDLQPGVAEAVSVTAKGKTTVGFRLRTASGGLYALDPNYGDEAARTEMRDRIVGRVNGEVQAPPGEADLPGAGRSAILRLAAPGESIDRRTPPLDSTGRLAPIPDESVVYSGKHRVIASRHERVAYGAPWRSMPGPRLDAEVSITSRRVVVTWPNWEADEAAQQFRERRQQAGYPDGIAPAAIAGQLAWQWISGIYVGNADEDGRCSLEFQATDRLNQVRLRLLDFAPELASSLLRDSASSVARYRMDTDDTLKPDEISSLAAIRDGSVSPEKLDWGVVINLPSSYKIAREP